MRKPLKWLRTTYSKLNGDIWKTPLNPLSDKKVYMIRQFRIAYLLYKSLRTDGIYIKASALTFFTILSVVPMVALAFGISKGFGLQDELRAQIITQFHNQEQVMAWILDFANNTLEQTSGGLLAGIGIALLFYTVLQLLTYVESIFNSIWKVDQTRVWYRQITDYLAIIILVPALFIASSSATVMVNTGLAGILEKHEVLESLKPFITFLFRLAPFVLMCSIATAAFLVMPNTKVRFRSAIVAGLLTGIFLQIIQILYIQMQLGATRLGTLYGSFAAIPLMMIWVQMSWVVVLIGAQLAFYIQNITRHEFEFDVQTVSPKQKKRISLLIMHTLVKDFVKGEKPRGSEDISIELNLPARSVRESLVALRDATLLTEVYEEVHDKFLYQPATDINKMTLAFVMEKLENSGSTHKNVINNSDYRKIDSALSRIDAQISASESNVLLRDL